ncbi:MAG: tetraacyldisaccharide 4'-kinase [Bacteroidota bacterium]
MISQRPNKFLLPLSWLYEIVITLRNWFYDYGIFTIHKFDATIISVGNITVGGTGKTPIIEFIAKYLLSKNKKVAVVSRGYKRKSSGQVVVSNGKKILVDSNISGDESMQMAKNNSNLVVIVDEKRYRGVETAKYNYNCDYILLDDGFQHRAVERNCNLVLIDGTKSIDEMNLIPAGEAREKFSSFKRSDAIIITKCQSLSEKTFVIDKIREVSTSPIFTTKENIISFYNLTKNKFQNINRLKNKSIIAFCGIANPEYFKANLEDIEISVLKLISFNDHHFYQKDDLKYILKSLQECNVKYVITTEKDAVKLPKEFIQKISEVAEIFYASYEVKIREEKEFKIFLNKYVNN